MRNGTLYKSYIFIDDAKSLGARFVMFYNAKPLDGSEKIFSGVSDDLRRLAARRHGTGDRESRARSGARRNQRRSAGGAHGRRVGDLLFFRRVLGSRAPSTRSLPRRT